MDTKFQKKHESDMTSKEKRELEREKLASMHGWEKLEYILGYYKFHIVVVLILILAVFGMTRWVDSLKDENYLYVTVMDATTEGENLMEDFRASLGDEEEHHKYFLDTSVFHTVTLEGESEMDYTGQMTLATLVGSATVDVLVCSEDIYEIYKGEEGEEVVYQISDLMGEEFVKEHEDICMEDAIRVDDNAVLEKYGLTTGKPAYLIVFQYSGHPEEAKAFINFLME